MLEDTAISLESKLDLYLIMQLAHRTTKFIFCGKATSNTASDIEYGESKFYFMLQKTISYKYL